MNSGAINLKFQNKEEELNGKVRFKVLDLTTLCPYRKNCREDDTELEITYKPGVCVISEEELKKYIENEIEGKSITTEMIP
jgi:NADPH-dependent 7-cyano-7-deazaguanine reductase QueF